MPTFGVLSLTFSKGTCLDSKDTLSAALATESADPLPQPPPRNELNKVAYTTINNHPELFKIVTPINVDQFEAGLMNHPNRAYVDSVCRGLREGFWPWPTHDNPNLWRTCDNSYRPINQAERMNFVREQRDEEIKLVNNHSQEPYSPNSMITNNNPSSPLDTIDDLSRVLLAARRDHDKNRQLALWKSDVKSAYRLIPMHPLWQLRPRLPLKAAAKARL
jgi:hypothetical protein